MELPSALKPIWLLAREPARPVTSPAVPMARRASEALGSLNLEIKFSNDSPGPSPGIAPAVKVFATLRGLVARCKSENRKLLSDWGRGPGAAAGRGANPGPNGLDWASLKRPAGAVDFGICGLIVGVARLNREMAIRLH